MGDAPEVGKGLTGEPGDLLGSFPQARPSSRGWGLLPGPQLCPQQWLGWAGLSRGPPSAREMRYINANVPWRGRWLIQQLSVQRCQPDFSHFASRSRLGQPRFPRPGGLAAGEVQLCRCGGAGGRRGTQAARGPGRVTLPHCPFSWRVGSGQLQGGDSREGSALFRGLPLPQGLPPHQGLPLTPLGATAGGPGRALVSHRAR